MIEEQKSGVAGTEGVRVGESDQRESWEIGWKPNTGDHLLGQSLGFTM